MGAKPHTYGSQSRIRERARQGKRVVPLSARVSKR